MKTIINVFLIMLMAFWSSCISDNVGPAGPAGPMGPQGDQGPKGDSGFVFEYEDIDFTGPEYEVFLPFPNDFESLSSDVALVYLLWDIVDIDGVDTEIWRQLPQTLLIEEGTLQYNFDFSMVDVRLFMGANFNMDVLGAIDTDDWVARVVIVPGDFWNSGRLMPGEIDYNDLKKMLDLPELAVPASAIKRRN